MAQQFSKVAALSAAAWLACAAATAAPVVIDSEQKANAAVLSAQKALTTPKQDLEAMTGYVRSIAESALQPLAATTTPIALINSRNGVVIACGTSGTLTARMARSFPRVLKLSWQACTFNDGNNYPHVRNGNAEIILVSDSFTPEKVAGIRFGTLNSDFTDSRHIEDFEYLADELRSMNLRVLGQIPMTRAFPQFGVFVGEFAFEMTGFIQDHARTVVPDRPPYEQISRMSAEFVIASGATTYDSTKTHSVEDLRLYFGKVSQSAGYPVLEPIRSYTIDGLKIRFEFDYAAWSSSKSVDGRIEFQHAPLAGTCLNGAYTIKTRARLVTNDLSTYKYDAGDLLINGSTTAQFFSAANVPPTLPVPQQGQLIHLDVRNVGTFNYDAPDLSILAQNAQCFGG